MPSLDAVQVDSVTLNAEPNGSFKKPTLKNTHFDYVHYKVYHCRSIEPTETAIYHSVLCFHLLIPIRRVMRLRAAVKQWLCELNKNRQKKSKNERRNTETEKWRIVEVVKHEIEIVRFLITHETVTTEYDRVRYKYISAVSVFQWGENLSNV